MAATGLGPGGSIPIGTTNPIEIPQSEAPEKVLRNDPLIPLPPLYDNGIVESFKVLAELSDNTPGYLSEKINTNQFSIEDDLITLIGFSGLTTDLLAEGSSNLYYSSSLVLNDVDFHTGNSSIHFSDLSGFNTDGLSEGSTNKYLTTTGFNAILTTKTSDDIAEGSLNQYFTATRFNSSFSNKRTTDLAEGSNLYFTDDRATSALSGHTDNSAIHLSNLNSFTTSNLAEGGRLYFSDSRAQLALSGHTEDEAIHFSNLSGFDSDNLTEGSVNQYFTDVRAVLALDPHTSDDSIHFSNLNGFNSDNLSEGSANLYLNQFNFDSFISAKTTDSISEGSSNFYYSSSRFDGSFQAKSSDDLQEGSVNKYVTGQLAIDIDLNTGSRHEHSNKSVLDSYTNSNSSITSAVTNSHTHINKAILDATEESFTSELKLKYDGFEAGSITSVLSPLISNSGVLSHSSLDGNKHVPSNASASQYDVLSSGTNAGDYAWASLETIIGNSSIFEATPSTSTTKGVQSNYINTHVSNGTANVKHVTDSNLTYLNTTIPSHISSLTLHVPSFFSGTDQGKFLYINSSDELDWATSSASVTITGESYLTASGSEITANKLDLSNTNIAEGSNITFDGNQISSAQRSISTNSINGGNETSISAAWAYAHEGNYGAGSHIPTGGTAAQYIDGTGAIANFDNAPGAIYKVILGSGATGSVTERLADEDTVFPTGFSGSVGASVTDLVISHDTTKAIVSADIYAEDDGILTKLISSGAYATIAGDIELTYVKIISLTTMARKLSLYLQFE